MSILQQVFDPETFRNNGHLMVDILADHLYMMIYKTPEKVIDFKDPDANYQYWSESQIDSPNDYFQRIKENSIHLHHPRYMGHQVTAPAPLAALVGFEGLLLNSGGAIYEMSAASSTLEKLVIDIFKPYFGFHEGDGILTSGGTLANLTALICARNIKAPEDIWNEGQSEKYAFMVSEEAHYCIDRAVRVMGWGDTGIIKVPVDKTYKMNTDLLAEYYEKAISSGIKVLGVVGSAPTTSTGIYDDLKAIGLFCKERNLWYHIDAAHGGPAVFSEKYKYLMAGCDMADSITVDAHKMMMVPSLTTMLFFKNTKDSYRTFAQKAQYLWSVADNEWFNYGKRTMECTKIMLSMRIHVLIKAYGLKVFEEYLDKCYNLAQQFAMLISKESSMELAVTPDSNIVCFRINHSDKFIADDINRKIRQKILEEGHFYIVQTTLRDKVFLRTSIMNPFTTMEDLGQLLVYIKEIHKTMN